MAARAKAKEQPKQRGKSAPSVPDLKTIKTRAKIKPPAQAEPKVFLSFGKLDMEAPHVGKIVGYRTVWALATLSEKDPSRLRCTHFCYCTIMGRNPLWGLYEVSGAYVASFRSRAELEAKFPKPAFSWRRIHARFYFESITPHQEREERLKEAIALFAKGGFR